MAKIAVYLTKPQIDALMNAATAMLAGQEGEGDFLCRGDVLDRAATALARASAGNQAEDDWTLVSERLPKEDVPVLLFDECGDRNCGVMQLSRHKTPHWFDDTGIEIEFVTHWQPLPEPPANIKED